MIEARYHDNLNALQGPAFQGEDARSSTPFDRADWFKLLSATGLEPQIFSVNDDHGGTAMVLTGSDGHLRPMRNWYSFIWRPQSTAHSCPAQHLEKLARTMKDHAYRVTLEPVPDDDGSATQLFNAFDKAGWAVSINACDTNHVLMVEDRNFKAFWGDRPGQLRTTLKRKSGKTRIELISEWDANAWADYEDIYRASWKPAEDQPDMLRAFAQQEAAAGRMRLGRAFAGEKAIAAQFWTVEGATAYIHKLAHLEDHKQLSAGTVLSAAMFERVIDTDRVDLIDFGTGNEPYKADWMEETRPRYRIDCLNLRDLRSWPVLAKSRLRRLIGRAT